MIKQSDDLVAAWLRVEPLLADVKRGDQIALSWLSETGQIDNPRRLDYRLKQYFKAKGIRLRLNRGFWRVCDDRDQKNGVRERQDHVRREHKRSLHEITYVNRNNLTDMERNEADYLQRHVLNALDLSKKMNTELRAILNSPVSQPRVKPEPETKPRILLGSKSRY